MPLINALDVARYRKLADDIDAALGRGDEMGMEMLRAMLPDVTEAIEEINEALREADGLLYEGLRDEAIGLHDEEFPAVALRLHLQDKPQWPMAALFFETEGITAPPALDFSTLSSLNTAFSELQALRKPLDFWRRMALERTPLGERILQLRKIQSHDPTKPVWADQIAAFEEVRILEVSDAVNRALHERKADHVAALHRELTREGWGVPIPRRLVEDTRGGEAWASLRRQLKAMDPMCAEIERVLARVTQADVATDDDVEALRRLVRQWEQAESLCREWLFALPQCAAVAKACQSEAFGPRLDEMRAKLTAALEYVARSDRSEALHARHDSAKQQLEYLVEHLPDTAGEAQWLSNVERALDSFRQTSQQAIGAQSAEFLVTKTARALEDVKARASRRSMGRVIQAAVAVAFVGFSVAGFLWWGQMRQAYRRELEWAQSLLPDARQGNYVSRPPRLEAFAAAYPVDPAVQEVSEAFGKEAAAELRRRGDFAALVETHKTALDKAGQAIQSRESPPERRLDEWPAEIFMAKDAFRKARQVGGLPWNRTTTDASATGAMPKGAALPADARRQCDEEEARLAELSSRQAGLERSLTNGAIEEFRRQLNAIVAAIPRADDAEGAAKARTLRGELSSLAALGTKEQSAEHQPIPRVPVTIRDQTEAVDRRLEKLID